jgi:PIN domain nuclease of toxin-antitoxin system
MALHTLIESTDLVGVSAISCFEIAWLSHNGRLQLPCPLLEWFAHAITEHIAHSSLPGPHGA